jgi:hypothetical protein
MEVWHGIDSDGSVRIYVQEGKVSQINYVYPELRVRVYSSQGDVTDLYGGWPTFGTASFKIEDYPSHFIDPYPNKASGYVRLELEFRYQLFGKYTLWSVYQDTRKEYSYPINSNYMTKPDIANAFSYLELSSGYKIKGASKVKAVITGTAKRNASITKCELTVDGKAYTASNGGEVTSNAFANSGAVKVTATVTDSRGFTNSVSETITVLNGFPTLDSFACSTGDYTGAFSYSFTPPVSSFYSKLKIETIVGSTASEVFTETIGAKNAGYTGTLAVANYLATIYGRYTTTPNTKLRATLLVYEDSSYTKLMNVTAPTRELDVRIPDNDSTKPIINSISCSPTVVLLGQSNLFIQGKNGIKTSMSSSGQHGTQIAFNKWVVDGVTYDNGEQTGILNASGNVTITATVTDQRGFSRSQTKTVKYEPYRDPAVVPVSGESAVHVERESGESTDKLFVSAAKSFSSVAGYNKCELRVRAKAGANSSYPTSYITLLGNMEGNEYNQSSGIDLAKDSIYYVEISVKDSLDGVSAVILAIPTAAVFMDRNGEDNSIAFGGYTTEKDAFEVYQTAYFYGGMYLADPTTGDRYKIVIENGALKLEQVPTSFNLRRR